MLINNTRSFELELNVIHCGAKNIEIVSCLSSLRTTKSCNYLIQLMDNKYLLLWGIDSGKKLRLFIAERVINITSHHAFYLSSS